MILLGRVLPFVISKITRGSTSFCRPTSPGSGIIRSVAIKNHIRYAGPLFPRVPLGTYAHVTAAAQKEVTRGQRRISPPQIDATANHR